MPDSFYLNREYKKNIEKNKRKISNKKIITILHNFKNENI